VQPPGRFGILGFDASNPSLITSFKEKPQGDGSWINGGFFVLDPKAIDYIKLGDKTVWEREPLSNLASDGKLAAFKHQGFWMPMDTLRDKMELEELWDSGKALWKVWDK
jgi:glucose-1-phosphate cytidylyltransferase